MLALLFGLAAQPLAPGDPLPPLEGEFLTGRAAELPAAAHGRVALVALGFTHASSHDVDAWIKRFRQDFGRDERATFYEVPLIGGLGRMSKLFIVGGMRRGTPKADYEHVMTVFSGTNPWKQRVGFHAPEAAYLILLDPSGAVRWLGRGPFSEAVYRELAAAARKMLPARSAAPGRHGRDSRVANCRHAARTALVFP